ncbi:MAG: UDP binding domain-containing protein, partial [Deltaproteobacteria bacterium]
FEIIEELLHLGAEVSYHDPHIPLLPRTRKHDIKLKSQPLTSQYLAAQDCVLIVTDHTAVDWNAVFKHSRLVVDPRNALGKIPGNREHVLT